MGSCACFYWGIVSDVKVMGWIGYKGVKGGGRFVSRGILLGFYCELSFLIVRSWCLIFYGVYLCSFFALITCFWILSLIVPLSLGTNTLFSWRKLWKSCIISLFTGAYVSFVYLIKFSFIYSYSAVSLYLLSL